LGTFFEISLASTLHTESDLHALADRAFLEVERLCGIFSYHDPESELSALNRLPVGETRHLSPEMNEVLSLALELQTQTEGRFNVAIADFLVAWKCLPGQVLPLSWEDSQTPAFEIQNGVFRKRHRARIDLGGIAKGSIVDRCVALMIGANGSINSCINGSINAGGDLRVFGERQDAWIRSGPSEASVLHPISLQNQAIATSTVQPLPQEGSPYVDLKTRSSLDRIQTCTAIADCCNLADAFTKIALLAPDSILQPLCERYGVRVLESPRIES